MSWFRENAALVQALSSVAALVVACVLVVLTAKYVRLTRQIAISSLQQVEHIREVWLGNKRKHARTLEALALRIRTALGRLDADAPRHAKLRQFDEMNEQDIADLRTHAMEVNDPAITSASEASGPLRVILGMVQKAKDISPGTGWVPNTQEIATWKQARCDAERALQATERACRELVASDEL
jgi:hypothetical protein